jgi:chemotaxis protein methyltransferase CheR
MALAVSTRTRDAAPFLNDGNYLRFRDWVQAEFGLSFPERKRPDLERGIKKSFAASTCASLDDYYDLLTNEGRGTVARAHLANDLTVNETHFFRNEGQFDALYMHVLPQLIERRRHLRTLRIWSAGCSTGEEPYSIAMLLRMLLPDVDEWSITILGTDVNTESLDRARKGVYSQWAFREAQAKEWQSRFFTPLGRRFEIAPEVRDMVTLRRLNLVEDTYPSYDNNTALMDLILCRNVTIYFDAPTTQAITDRFYESLTDGGWFIIGHSEHSMGTYRRFQTRSFSGAILYQRTGTPTEWPADWEWLVGSTPQAGMGQDRSMDRIPEMVTESVPFGPEQPNETVLQPTEPVQELGLDEQPEPIAEEVLLELEPDQDPVETARELLDLGHSEQARDLLLSLSRETRGSETVHVLLGQACANLGLWSEAEGWCREAIREDPLSLQAHYVLALVLQHQGELKAAIEAMRRVVYIDRTYILGHFGLADLYRGSNQIPQALKSLDNARRLLEARSGPELVPDSGGITFGRLQETVERQQQQWAADAL